MIKKKPPNYFLIFIVILFGFLFSCKKDNPDSEFIELSLILSKPYYNIPETIKPTRYLPIHPNSSWTYFIDDSYRETINTTDFVLYHVSQKSIDCRDEIIDSLNYKPYYTVMYNDCGIFGNRCFTLYKPLNCNPYQVSFSILKEEIGSTYYRSYKSDTRMGDNRYSYTTMDIFKEGDKNILYIEGNGLDYSNSRKVSHKLYYKEDVGLFKEFRIYSDSGDTIFRKLLIDYKINLK